MPPPPPPCTRLRGPALSFQLLPWTFSQCDFVICCCAEESFIFGWWEERGTEGVGRGRKPWIAKGDPSFYILFLEREAGRRQSLNCSTGRLGLRLYVCVLLGVRMCERLVWGSPLTLDTKGSIRVNIHSLGQSLSSFCHLGVSVAI